MAELRLKSTGTIKLFENDNTSSVTIASPASLGADRTITLPDASVTLASGTMLATDGSGASLTALNASELGSGTVPTARLGSGTASSSTVLYGDQTYKAEPTGGKLLQVINSENGYRVLISTTSLTDMESSSGVAWEVAITPSATSSKVLFSCHLALTGAYTAGADAFLGVKLFEKIGAGAYAAFGGAANAVSNLQGNHAGIHKTTGEEISLGNLWNQSILRTTNTTSAVSYKIQWNCRNASASSYNNDETGSQITLMEIGA